MSMTRLEKGRANMCSITYLGRAACRARPTNAPVIALCATLLTVGAGSAAPRVDPADGASATTVKHVGPAVLLDPEPTLDALSVDPLTRAHAALYDAAMLRAAYGVSRAAPDPQQLHGLVRQALDLLAAKRPSQLPRGRSTAIAPRSEVAQAIMSAARTTGAPRAYLWRTAARESGFNPTAASAASTARGLYQFVEQTWLAALWRHGGRHGFPAAGRIARSGSDYVVDGALRDDILNLRNDPWLAARMAGELANENRRTMERSLGRRVSEGDLYVAHFLGAAGALRLVRAANRSPGASAARLFPVAARANRAVFHHRGRPLNCRELLERLRHG